MPKLKLGDDDLDIDALEDAEYQEDEYEEYTGKQPPAGTVLAGHIKKMWWTYTNNGDGMLVALFVADGNTGDEKKFNGLPVWDRLALTTAAKFRWKPFLDATGIALREIKAKMVVAEDDDNIGAPISKIGRWEPGEDALARIITKRDRYEGEVSTKVKTWLAYAEAEDEDEEEGYEDEEDELEEEEDEDEDDVQGRRTGRVAHPTRAAKPPAKPAPARQRTARSATARGKAAPAARKRSPVGRRGSKTGYDDDPPF